MSQSDPSNYVAVGTSGPDLVAKMNLSGDAYLTTNKGGSAPTYADGGTFWLDDNTSPWVLKMYDGADWIIQGYFDAGTNLYTPVCDVVTEATADTGVTVDGVLCKDGDVTISGNRLRTGVDGADLFLIRYSADDTDYMIKVHRTGAGDYEAYVRDGGADGKIWHSENDGVGSGLDADLMHGKDLTSSGDRWDVIPRVGASGNMPTGFALDFYEGDAADPRDGRLQVVSNALKYDDTVDNLFVPMSDEQIKIKTVDIGTWDMDATATVTKALGVSGANIRGVPEVLIFADDGNFYPLGIVSAANYSTQQGGIVGVSSTGVITLGRLVGGFFDHTLFDNPGNRGYITFKHV